MANPSNNPLLAPLTLPHGAYPLDKIKAEHYLPALQEGIRQARADIADIKNNKDEPDFKNTIEKLEFSGALKSYVARVFSHMSALNKNNAIRAVEDEFKKELVAFGNDVMLDAELFSRIKAVYNKKSSLGLTPEQNMLLEETYKSFIRSGASLDEADKKRLREIDERMSELGSKFSNNKLDATKAYQKIIESEEDLKGLPDRIKTVYKEAAKEAGMPGKWIIRLFPPPMDIYEYADNRSLREEITRAYGSLGYPTPGNEAAPDNRPIILEMLKLREERAKLFGFANHAAYVLDDRMAKNPETVMKFLEENNKVYRPAAEEYLKKVKDYAFKTDGLDSADFKPWDFNYYNRRLKEETIGINLEELRAYFNLDQVLDGLFKHAEKLFDIKINEKPGKYPVWHSDVKTYEITDNETGETIGLFTTDYFARGDVKQDGAWMNNLRERGMGNGVNEFGFILNACNFQKPPEGKPCLLSLDGVRTLFHEFGHGLHGLLAKGNYKSLTGTSVKWDFVELPSQLQENWAKTKEVLDTFAIHPDTKQPLSEEVVKKINRLENMDAGYFGLRQTYLAMLDMTYHTTDTSKITSVEELEDSVVAKYMLFPRLAGLTSTGFSHIFSGGYSAGYYSYKWAEVLEADLFEMFENDLYDKDAKKKIKPVYQDGGTKDPNDIFKNARGREPDPTALFRREGLLSANKNEPVKVKTPQFKRP